MLKKVLFITLCLLLATIVSCQPKATVNPMEEQVKKEAKEFENVIVDIAQAADGIKYLADVSLSSMLPQDWLCDVNQPSGDKLSAAFGIPVPKDIARGMKHVKAENFWSYYTLGDQMDPATDKYIVTTYSGTSQLFFDKTTIKDFNDYPKLISLSCFSDKKIVQSPYFIPNEATHGLYLLSGNEFRRGRGSYNITQLVTDLSAANPYVEKGGVAQSEAPKLPEVVKSFKGQLAAITNDLNTANKFATAIEVGCGKNLRGATAMGGIEGFRKMLEDNKALVSKIDASLGTVATWDFSNLAKYRSLKVK